MIELFINKIKPKPKFKFLKKFKDDFLFKFLYKNQKFSNKKLLHKIFPQNLGIFSENVLNNNNFSEKNQDFIYFKLKKKFLSKNLIINFLYLNFFFKKNLNIKLKFVFILLSTLLLKGYFFSLKKNVSNSAFSFVFKNSKEFLKFSGYLKTFNLKIGQKFLQQFYLNFYTPEIFFFYKNIYSNLRKNSSFFKKKGIIPKIWLGFLISKFASNSNYLLNKKLKKRVVSYYNYPFFKVRKKYTKLKSRFLTHFWKLIYFTKKNKLIFNDKIALSRIRYLKKFLILNLDQKKKSQLLELKELIDLSNLLCRLKKYSYFLSQNSKLNKNNFNFEKLFIKYLFLLKVLKKKYIVYFSKLKNKLKILDNDIFFLKKIKLFSFNKQFKKLNYLKKKRLNFSKNFFEDKFFLKKRLNLKFQYALMRKLRSNIRNSKNSFSFSNNRISPFKQKMLYLEKLTLFFENIKKKQVKKYIFNALKIKGDSIKFFLITLESRIDVILFRLGFFRSFGDIRNLILKKNVYLFSRSKNMQKLVLTGSHHIKKNQIFFIKNKEIIFFKFVKESFFRKINLFQIPEYLEFNFFSFQGIFLTDLVKPESVFYPLANSDFFGGTLENLRDILK